MAATFTVRYKNHCTPQEQILTGGRYYLDSDCGRKLTGDCSISGNGSGVSFSGYYEDSLAVSDSASSALSGGHDFLFVKNTGSSEVYLAIDGTNFLIALAAGEAFASGIHTSANAKVRCEASSGNTSTIEYFAGT